MPRSPSNKESAKSQPQKIPNTAPVPASESNNNNGSHHINKSSNVASSRIPPSIPAVPTPANRPKFVFRCQQAHGSPTGLISGFTNVKELYQKIAECYGFPVEEILFCTLNTHRVEMTALLSAQLSLEDFIFVHRKGTKKEVEITKTSEALGLTITDNGTGYSFIKRIKDASIVKNTGVIEVGDHIERIDGQSLVGWRHIEVAKYLRSIPLGHTFTIRLIEPIRAGFANIGPRSTGAKPKGVTPENAYKTGKETIRFRSNGALVVEVVDNTSDVVISKINGLLENFVGISDIDLATQVWEMSKGRESVMDFAEVLDNSELGSFGFSDDFIMEVWSIATKSKIDTTSQ